MISSEQKAKKKEPQCGNNESPLIKRADFKSKLLDFVACVDISVNLHMWVVLSLSACSCDYKKLFSSCLCNETD